MDFPTPEQELDRKTVAEIERIIHGLQTGKLTLPRAASSMLTLWQIVSGLVPKETMDVLGAAATDVAQKYRALGAPDNVAFLTGGPGGAYVVRRDGSEVTIHAWVGMQSTQKVYRAPVAETFPERWAFEQFEAIVKKLSLIHI